MVGWYRRFIEGFATIAAPLYDLLRNEHAVEWQINKIDTPQNKAFEELKCRLTKFPILRLPNFKKQFIVIPDASGYATGAILAQEHEGFEHPIHYISKTMDDVMRRAHSYEQEALAMVRALNAFQHYLFGTKFTVATDCRALSHWNTTKVIPPKVERWLAFIQSFDITFEHRPGTQLRTSDTLSRDERHNIKSIPEFESKMLTAGCHAYQVKAGNMHIKYVRAITLLDTLGINYHNINKEQQLHPMTRYMIKYLCTGKIDLKLAPSMKESITTRAQYFVVAGGLLCRPPELNKIGTIRPFVPPSQL